MSERLTLLDADNSLPASKAFFGTPQPVPTREGLFHINVEPRNDMAPARFLPLGGPRSQWPGL